MCYLIQFGVPAMVAGRVAPKRLPRVKAHNNPSVRALFGRTFELFSVSERGCSCALYASSDSPQRQDERARVLRRKYERLRWSEEKINRALASSTHALSHNQHGMRAGLRDDVAAYLTGLVEQVGEVKLTIHHFHGSFAEEEVPVVETIPLSAVEFSSGAGTIRENTLYVIRHAA